jgi:hypothetical protein
LNTAIWTPEASGGPIVGVFATNCAKAYARASAPTRRRFNQAVFSRIDVRDGKIFAWGPPAVRPALFFDPGLLATPPPV